MSDQPTTLSLHGLTALEVEEFKAELAAAGCNVASVLKSAPEPGAVGGARKGEPFTLVAIVALSQLAVTGLVAFLSRTVNTGRKWEKLTMTRPDGEALTYEVMSEASSKEAIRADIIEKLGKWKVQLPEA